MTLVTDDVSTGRNAITRLVVLESGLGFESGLESIFAGLGLGLGLEGNGLGLGLGLGCW